MNYKTFILDFLYVQLSERIPSLVNPKHDQAPGPAALSQCRTRWPTELVVPALLPFLLFPFGVMPLLRSVHSHPKCQKYLTLAYLGILSSPPNSQSWASIICHGKIPRWILWRPWVTGVRDHGQRAHIHKYPGTWQRTLWTKGVI